MSSLEVVASVFLAAIPIGLSVWALLDAARRPEWAFSFANRSRTVWVAACAVGVLFCGPGLVISLWYLLRVRSQVADVEAGRLAHERGRPSQGVRPRPPGPGGA